MMSANAYQETFKHIDRNRPDTIALLPGWATDCRIFDNLNLKFNYLLPHDFSPFTFEKKLLEATEKMGLKKISLFGWSLGGFAAAEFAARHANIVEKLILVSIRKRYKKEELEEVKKLLKKNKRGYLYKFFAQCFPGKEEFSRFRENLLKAYCGEFDLERLLAGIDYLENAEIKVGSLRDVRKVTIVHGKKDRVAPFKEAVAVKDGLQNAEFIAVEGAGHMPFLEEALSEKI